MAVYVLKFLRPIGDTSRPGCFARYYIGWARDEDLPARIAKHRKGAAGCALTTYAYHQGIGFRVVRVLWGLSRTDERRLKNAGHYRLLDPAVRPDLYRPAWSRPRLDSAALQVHEPITPYRLAA